MTNLIECESCKKLMQDNQVSIFDKEIGPGVQARAWSCVHCNHKHIFLVTDKTSRRMMEENKKEREHIGGINRRAQLLRKQNKFTSGQAQHALKQMEDIEKRIVERTKELDERSRKLLDEYKEKV